MTRARLRMLVLAGVLAATAIAGVPAAFGQVDTGLGGWVLNTAAAPVSFVFNSPSAGIPASPTGELHLARTIARSETGVGYGLASIAWPGPVAANAGPLASQEVPAGIKQGMRDGGAPESFVSLFDNVFPLLPTIPRYEVRSESFHPQGPPSSRTGVQGARMDTTAREGHADGFASIGGANIRGLIDAAAISSSSITSAADGRALSEARAAIKDLSLLGGLITVEQLTTTVTAVSDGDTATLDGALTFTGLRIADQAVGSQTIPGASLSLDGDGFHALGRDAGPGSKEINEFGQTLADRGIQVIVTRPIDSKEGATASRSIDGVMIVFEAGAIQPYVDMMPEAVQARLRQYIAFDQVVIVTLGSGSASAAAAPPLPSFTPPIVNPPILPPQIITLPGAPGGVVTVEVPGQPVQRRVPFIDATPVAAVAVPAGLAAVVVLLGIMGAFGLANVADRATTMRAEVGCPLEGR